MNLTRGEIWPANLNPTQGSEQAGIRPVLIFQNNTINRFSATVLTIPFTTNPRRVELPSCVLIKKREGGLTSDSVVLCHQLRVLDKTRLVRRLGSISQETMVEIDSCVLFTLGV